MSLLSTPDTLSLSPRMDPSSETPVLMTLEYDDYPDPELPACSLCLTLNTSEYCHHTGQPHQHLVLMTIYKLDRGWKRSSPRYRFGVLGFGISNSEMLG